MSEGKRNEKDDGLEIEKNYTDKVPTKYAHGITATESEDEVRTALSAELTQWIESVYRQAAEDMIARGVNPLTANTLVRSRGQKH